MDYLKTGGIITLLLLLPNLFWFMFKKNDNPANQAISKILEISEHVLRMLVFLIPFFYDIQLSSTLQMLAAGIALFALSLYYFCWLRYYFNKLENEYLHKKLWFMPLPMAVFPLIYLLFASIVIESAILGVLSILFGIIHIYVSKITLVNNNKGV